MLWRASKDLKSSLNGGACEKMSGTVQRSARTLYSTMQTKALSGIRKKLMIVARISSGTCCARIFIMDGQKRPTQNSNTQKAASWICPSHDMPAQQQNISLIYLKFNKMVAWLCHASSRKPAKDEYVNAARMVALAKLTVTRFSCLEARCVCRTFLMAVQPSCA